MSCNSIRYGVYIFFLAIFTACGGGGVSEFDDSDLPSPTVGSLDPDGGVTPGEGGEPVDPTSSGLPQVDAGNTQYSDPNVLVFLRGEATAAEGATVERQVWRQLDGPEVTLTSPTSATTGLVSPDVDSAQTLTFQYIAQDSEGRVNSATTSVVVEPSPAFARVVGGIAQEGDESVMFNVRLGKVEAQDVTIDYSTRDGSALAGVDYEATAGTLVIPTGETSAEVEVPLLMPDGDQESESFTLQITVLDTGESSLGNAGVVLIRDITGDREAAPALLVVGPLVFVPGDSVSLPLLNTGGMDISACTALPALPEGLTLAPSEDGTTCVISGSVEFEVATQDYLLTATNENGSGTETLSLTVANTLSAPDFAAPDAQMWVVEQPIDFSLTNTGGGSLESCASEPELPAGVTLAIAEDATTCVLSGAPTATQAATEHTVTAINGAGSAAATLSITVTELLAAPELADFAEPVELVLSLPIEGGLVFSNLGGGLLNSCSVTSEERLPEGLEVAVSEDASTCVITGTPTSRADVTVMIQASNAAADSDATIRLVVLSEPPILAEPEPLILTVGQTVNLDIENSGGDVDTCASDPALPSGLSFNTTEDLSTCALRGVPSEVSAAADYQLTATNDGGTSPSVTLNLSVLSDLIAPALVDQTLSMELNATQLVELTNNGGGELSSCNVSSDDNLPEGLELSVNATGLTCVISGAPTQVGNRSLQIEAVNSAGRSNAVIQFSIVPLAPAITTPDDQVFTVGDTITPIVFSNEGGSFLTSCTASPALPVGLTVAPDGAQSERCLLSGTPSVASAVQDYTVTATNAGGSDSVIFSITVEEALTAPSLSGGTLNFTLNEAASVELTNNGGGELTQCRLASEGSLPTGLSLGANGDASTCLVSGTPTQPGLSTIELEALNAAGNSVASVTFNVRPPAPDLQNAPDQSFTVGTAISPVMFTNTGGEFLSSCTVSPALPAGLSVARNVANETCVLSGTPSAAVTSTSYQVTATNTGGSDSASIVIVVENLIPDLTDPGALSFPRLEAITPVVVADQNGGALTACAVVDTLPTGLSFLRDSENGTCVLSGTPQEASLAQTYQVSGSNAAGTDTLSLSITVEPLLFADTLEIPIGNNTFNGQIQFNNGVVQIDWLDGSEPQLLVASEARQSINHTFTAPRPNVIRLQFTAGSEALEELLLFGTDQTLRVFDLEGAVNLRTLSVTGQRATFNATVEEIATAFPNIESLNTARFTDGAVTGAVADLPSTMRDLNLQQTNDALVGPVSSMPSGMTSLILVGSNHSLEGLVSDFPSALERVILTGGAHSDLGGTVESLPPSIRSVGFSNTTNISANFDAFPADFEPISLDLRGAGITVTGSIASLPRSLTVLYVLNGGTTEITGDVADLPPGIEVFWITTNNEVSGDLANIPSSLSSFILQGQNTLGGNVQDMPLEMRFFQLYGNNQVSGSLTEMVQNTLTNLEIRGDNTIRWEGPPASWAPSSLSGFQIIDNGNFISGDHYFNQTAMDELLIFLSDNMVTRTSRRSISINRVADSPRSSASDAAVEDLDARGYNVFTPVAD